MGKGFGKRRSRNNFFTGTAAGNTKQSTLSKTPNRPLSQEEKEVNNGCLLLIHFFINKDVATEDLVMTKTKKVSAFKKLPFYKEYNT